METIGNKLRLRVKSLSLEKFESEANWNNNIVNTYITIAGRKIENLIKNNPENNYFAECLILPNQEASKCRFQIAEALTKEGFECTVNPNSIYVVLKIK